jgi:hypothetical protein
VNKSSYPSLSCNKCIKSHKGLKKYSINAIVLAWIENHLADRKQMVVVDGFTSLPEIINAGVHQGSVLRPFLFLLYIDDSCDGMFNCIGHFADDTGTSFYAVIDH